MTVAKKYREFLKSEFWRALSSRKKKEVGKCEVCGAKSGLQSHHIRYPRNWYDTRLEDLEVLCRKCHSKEHGLWVEEWNWLDEGKYFYGEDTSRAEIWLLGKIWEMHIKLSRGGDLTNKELKYLGWSLKRGFSLSATFKIDWLLKCNYLLNYGLYKTV